MKIIRIAQTPVQKEYMLENGMLYDENADDVFSMKELISYNVPLFKNPSDANEFLSALEQKTNRTFGRVPERDFMHEVRYKDTRKEKEKARMEDIDRRNEKWKKGYF